MSEDIIAEVGRTVVNGYYDYQSVRLGMSNRIRDIVRKVNEGISFNEVEEKKEDKKFSKDYADKNLPDLLDTMLSEEKLTDEQYEYVQNAVGLLSQAKSEERLYQTLMKPYISSEQVYIDFLSQIKGVGPVLSSNLIHLFGYCERFDKTSSLWKYCGLHVVDGKAPKRTKGQKIDWNPKAKVLSWKIADCMIKQNTPLYRGIYDTEKSRQLKLMDNGSDHAPKNKLHAHLRSMRKMVKMFLHHYWFASREMKGLPLSKPYSVDVLGHTYISWHDAVKEQTRKYLK